MERNILLLATILLFCTATSTYADEKSKLEIKGKDLIVQIIKATPVNILTRKEKLKRIYAVNFDIGTIKRLKPVVLSAIKKEQKTLFTCNNDIFMAKTLEPPPSDLTELEPEDMTSIFAVNYNMFVTFSMGKEVALPITFKKGVPVDYSRSTTSSRKNTFSQRSQSSSPETQYLQQLHEKIKKGGAGYLMGSGFDKDTDKGIEIIRKNMQGIMKQ